MNKVQKGLFLSIVGILAAKLSHQQKVLYGASRRESCAVAALCMPNTAQSQIIIQTQGGQPSASKLITTQTHLTVLTEIA